MRSDDPTSATPRLNAYATMLEHEVLSRVGAARALLTHPGAKGQLVESAFRDALVSVLGGRFSIGTGQIIDTRGRTSGQMDLVIYNGDQILPPRNAMDPALFLVDAVNSVVEVKTSLTLAHIDKIMENATTNSGPKHVKRSFGYGDTIPSFVTPSAFARLYMTPAFGLIASDTTVTPETLIERLTTLDTMITRVSGKAEYHLPPLDAVFVLGMGEFRNTYHFTNDGPALVTHRPRPDLQEGNWEYFSSEDKSRSITNTLLAAAAWLHGISPRIQRRFSPALHYFMEPGNDPGNLSEVDVRKFVVKNPELTRLSPHVHPPV